MVFCSVVSRTVITAAENTSQDATALAPGPSPDPGPGPGTGTGTTNTGSLAPNTGEKAETTVTTRTAAPPPRSPGSTREVDTTEQVTWLLHIISTSPTLSADSVGLMTLWSGSSSLHQMPHFVYFVSSVNLNFPQTVKCVFLLILWVASLPQAPSIYRSVCHKVLLLWLSAAAAWMESWWVEGDRGNPLLGDTAHLGVTPPATEELPRGKKNHIFFFLWGQEKYFNRPETY